MKNKFSISWISSKQVRKQRKYRANAPLHIKSKFLASTLDKELRKKHSIRNLEIKKGDEVKIMRGKFKKKQSKVEKVEINKTRVSLEGITRTKKDGTKIPVWFHPSKLKIITLNLEDKKRLKSKTKQTQSKPEESNKTEEKKNALKKK